MFKVKERLPGSVVGGWVTGVGSWTAFCRTRDAAGLHQRGRSGEGGEQWSESGRVHAETTEFSDSVP